MLEKVRKYIELHHMLEKNDKIVIGVSGGADSLALLLLLNRLREEYDLQLFAVHINHGIRGEAAKGDAEYVEEICGRCRISFHLFETDVKALAKSEGKSEEEMGREYRYRCFEQVAKREGVHKIAVAHHMGDQAETVLFHLIRGTNLSGMTGIRPVNDLYIESENRKQGNIKIIRPLLKCSKSELKTWLTKEEVAWKEDATNSDNQYARNKIRNRVLPVLKEINEGAVKHIVDLADCLTEYEIFFRKAVEEYLKQNVILEENGGEGCLTDRRRLQNQEQLLRTAVIYEMITSVCGAKKDISREHVQAVDSLLNKQSGKKVMLPHQMEAVNSYEKLIIRKCFKRAEEITDWEQEILLRNLLLNQIEEQRITLPFGSIRIQIHCMENDSKEEKAQFLMSAGNFKNNYTKFFDCDKIKDTLYVRTPKKEDYFIMDDKGRQKKLSRYFIDKKLPVEDRRNKILVAGGHEVLWVVGERRCETYKINENTKYVLVLTYEGENNGLSY